MAVDPMLLVKTKIGKSDIHGLGLFAAERITQGTIIWRFTPGFDLDLDPAQLELQPSPVRERLRHYGYLDPRLKRFILGCDDARFINHSNSPNMRVDFSADSYGLDVAVRDIEVGEELTVDYGSVEGARPEFA